MRTLGQGPTLLFSTRALIIEGTSYPGAPLLIDSRNNVVWAVTDWLRHLLLKGGGSQGTVSRKAYAVRQWFDFLESQKTGWDDAKDTLVRLWRRNLMADFLAQYDRDWVALNQISNEKIRANKRKRLGSRQIAEARHKPTVSFKLDTITQFYLWAQRNGYIKFRIIGVADLARGIAKPPLTIKSSAKIDPATGEILSETAASPWRYSQKIQTKIDIPSGDEIEAIKDALGELAEIKIEHSNPILVEALLERNALIIDLGHIGQLRRQEVTRLTTRDIPDYAAVTEHLEKNKSYLLDVLGKGGKWRKVGIPPYQLEQLRLYIDGPRKDLIADVRSRRPRSKDQEALFPSLRDGGPLSVRGVHAIIERLRERTGIDIRFHLLRHRGITEYLVERRQLQIDSGVAPDDGLLLVEVKDRLGHSEKTETARTYLHLSKLEMEHREKSSIDSEKLQLKRQIRHLQVRLKLRKDSSEE